MANVKVLDEELNVSRFANKLADDVYDLLVSHLDVLQDKLEDCLNIVSKVHLRHHISVEKCEFESVIHVDKLAVAKYVGFCDPDALNIVCKHEAPYMMRKVVTDVVKASFIHIDFVDGH